MAWNGEEWNGGERSGVEWSGGGLRVGCGDNTVNQIAPCLGRIMRMDYDILLEWDNPHALCGVDGARISWTERELPNLRPLQIFYILMVILFKSFDSFICYILSIAGGTFITIP